MQEPRLGRVRSAVVQGVRATPVTVEVDLRDGVPRDDLVGLPSAVVRESLARVRAACRHSGFEVENHRTTINLAPADQRKSTAGLDLPIALALLQAQLGERPDPTKATAFWLGELALDGTVRPVPGIVPVALALRTLGKATLIVPRHNATEVAEIPGIDCHAVSDLSSAWRLLRGQPAALAKAAPSMPSNGSPAGTDAGDVGGHADSVDLAAVVGQQAARRALELAAAGGHHMLMSGPPGAGKTLLARALPSILPPLAFDESLEASAIHSTVGRLFGRGLLRLRPFRAPHHSSTLAGLVGGGVPPRPGEISLAHHGVLFLDELPEFERRTLEALRQPLEEGRIVLTRHRQTAEFPARFQLVAAMNPCPCGRGAADPECRCGPGQVALYRRRVSGAILDRIDLHVGVRRTSIERLTGSAGGEPSNRVLERVVTARQRQAERIARIAAERDEPAPGSTNAALPASWLEDTCPLPDEWRQRAADTADRLRLSARGWHRVLRVARTAADLEGAEEIAEHHIAEALQYRQTADPDAR